MMAMQEAVVAATVLGVEAVETEVALSGRQFYFMRHGQTAWNASGLICGRLDPPLDETGCRQAEEAGRVLAGLAFDGVAVSPQWRARQTAALALPGRPLHGCEGLRERDWGALEGRPLAEQCGYRETPAGGESWADFLTRVQGALQQVLAEYDRPLIIAHSGVWRALRALATGAPEGPRIANARPVLVVPSARLLSRVSGAGAAGRNQQETSTATPVPAAVLHADVPVINL